MNRGNRVRIHACAFLFVVIVPLSAQEEPSSAGRVQGELQKFEAKIVAAKETLVDHMSDCIADEKDAARKEQLEIEFDAFVTEGVLPAFAGQAAIQFEGVRHLELGRMVARLETLVKERWVCDSDAATAYVGERLESLREAHELASWKDLRCGPKFAAAVANAGFTWDGPSILSPEGKRGTMRVPSWLDREAYEYEVRFEVERMAGDGPLTLLFPLAGRPQPRDLGAFVMDGEQGTTCGFDGRDRKPLSETGEARQEPLLRKEQPMVVHLTCRTSHVRVEVDGTSVASLKDLNRLHLPKPLRDQFADKLDALHVRTAEGTRFRFRGLGWRLLPKHDKDVPLASTQAKRVQDMMPLGTTWTGKSHRDEVAVTAKVVARNQVARTATLDLRGHGRNRWNVRIAVSTNANGTTFEIDGAQRKDAKVAIYNETGNGTVANGTITMKWDWKNSTRGKKGYSEDGFSGRK